MIVHLRGAERCQNQAVFERLFRLRYDVFVTQRQWSLPTREGQEIDEYDCDDAVYFFEADPDGTIVSHVRLTPTRTHSLLADYFPHLVEGDVNPRGDKIWECTRYIVKPSQKNKEANRRAKSELVVYMLEWCKSKGISHIQTVIDTVTYPTFVEMTEQTRPLGLSHPFGGGPEVPGGGECMAWRWPVTSEVIDDIRNYGVPPKLAA